MADILKLRGQRMENNKKAEKKGRKMYYDEIAERKHKSETELKNYYGRYNRIRKTDIGDFIPIIVFAVIVVLVALIILMIDSKRNRYDSSEAASITDASVTDTINDVATDNDSLISYTTEVSQPDKDVMAKQHDVVFDREFYDELVEVCKKDKTLEDYILSSGTSV